jgi:hypothetical protein
MQTKERLYLILASAKSTKVLSGFGCNVSTKKHHDTANSLVGDGNVEVDLRVVCGRPVRCTAMSIDIDIGGRGELQNTKLDAI